MTEIDFVTLQTIGSTNAGVEGVSSGFREFIETITDIQTFIFGGLNDLLNGLAFFTGG